MKIALVTGEVYHTDKVEFEADGIKIGHTVIPFWKVESMEDAEYPYYDGPDYDYYDDTIEGVDNDNFPEPSEEELTSTANELMWNHSIPGDLALEIAENMYYNGYFPTDYIEILIDNYYKKKYSNKDKLQVNVKLVVEDEW